VTKEQSCHQQLESFIRHRVELVGEWIETDFIWPHDLKTLVAVPTFSGFQWLGMCEQERVKVLGIRALFTAPFLSLDELIAAGFCIESRSPPDQTAVLGAAEHYVVAELLSADAVNLYDCVHEPPRTWHVRAEHTLRKHQRRHTVIVVR